MLKAVDKRNIAEAGDAERLASISSICWWLYY